MFLMISLTQYVSDVHVFIVSILEMKTLKSSTEVKQLAHVVERKLEARKSGTNSSFLKHYALLPLRPLERT